MQYCVVSYVAYEQFVTPMCPRNTIIGYCWSASPNRSDTNLLRKWHISSNNFTHDTKWTVYSASICIASLIIIPSRKAPQYMFCSPNAILFILQSCYVSEVCWVRLSESHVMLEMKRSRGREGRHYSAHQSCPSLLPDKAKSLLICLWSLC